MPRDEIPKRKVLYLSLHICLSLCYPLFGRKLTPGGYIIGAPGFLDHLASCRDWRREDSQIRIFVSSAPPLQGHLGLALYEG